MQQIIQKAEKEKEKMGIVSENVTALEKKKKELERRLNALDANLHEEMEKLRKLLCPECNSSHFLSKSIRKKIGELFEERRKINYELEKCNYHLVTVKNALSKIQEKLQDSSDIYFYSR